MDKLASISIGAKTFMGEIKTWPCLILGRFFKIISNLFAAMSKVALNLYQVYVLSIRTLHLVLPISTGLNNIICYLGFEFDI